MKYAIIYFFTCLFLLFVVESRVNVNTLRNDYLSHSSQNLPKKANRLNQTVEKISVQQQIDNFGSSSLELDETDFQISDTAKAIIFFASVFGMFFIFGLNFLKRAKQAIHDFCADILSVKKFIFIRSIRI